MLKTDTPNTYCSRPVPWELELCSNKSVTYRLEHKLYTDKQVTYWWELEFCTNAPITFWELKLCPFKPVTYWELKLCNNKLVTYWSRPVPWNLTITFGCRSTSHNKFNCLRLNVCQVVFFLNSGKRYLLYKCWWKWLEFWWLHSAAGPPL